VGSAGVLKWNQDNYVVKIEVNIQGCTISVRLDF